MTNEALHTMYFGPRDGCFNLLNVPKELYDVKGPERFWEEYNKPWLDAAIARGDIIVLATEPTQEVCYFNDSKLGKQLTGFGREYQYLLDHGYYYDEITHQMRK